MRVSLLVKTKRWKSRRRREGERRRKFLEFLRQKKERMERFWEKRRFRKMNEDNLLSLFAY